MKKTITIREGGATDSEQARTRETEVQANLENYIKELEENDVGDKDTRNEVL